MREDSISIPLDDQGWHVDVRQVIAEVGQPRRHTVQSPLSGGSCRDIPAHLDGIVADASAEKHINVGTLDLSPYITSTPVAPSTPCM